MVIDCVIITVVKRKVLRTTQTVDMVSRIAGSAKMTLDGMSELEKSLPRLDSSVTPTTGLCCQSASILVDRFSNCTRVSYRTGHRCLFLESVAVDIVRAYSLAKGPIFV